MKPYCTQKGQNSIEFLAFFSAIELKDVYIVMAGSRVGWFSGV